MAEEYVIISGKIFECGNEVHANKVATELFSQHTTKERGIYRAVALISWPESIDSSETRHSFSEAGLVVVAEGKIFHGKTFEEIKKIAISGFPMFIGEQRRIYVTRGTMKWPDPPWKRPASAPNPHK